MDHPTKTEGEVRALIAEAQRDAAWNKHRSEVYRLELTKHKDSVEWIGRSTRAFVKYTKAQLANVFQPLMRHIARKQNK